MPNSYLSGLVGYGRRPVPRPTTSRSYFPGGLPGASPTPTTPNMIPGMPNEQAGMPTMPGAGRTGPQPIKLRGLNPADLARSRQEFLNAGWMEGPDGMMYPPGALPPLTPSSSGRGIL